MKFTFQTYSIIFSLSFFSIVSCSQPSQTSFLNEDTRIFNDILKKISKDKDLATGDLIVEIGQYFLETPYVAHTLEISGDEKLIINLREMDCTTFAENCLALARTIKNDDPSEKLFCEELTAIRYREKTIDKYPSRLHYFSDWIFDNDRKKIVENITAETGGIDKKSEVNFMSNHPESYSALKANPEFISEIDKLEQIISKRKFTYIPKERISQYEKLIRNGDIIGISTDIEGMDIMHVVIAVWQKDKLHLLHASQTAGKVVVSGDTLNEYLKSRKKATGIVIARPL